MCEWKVKVMFFLSTTSVVNCTTLKKYVPLNVANVSRITYLSSSTRPQTDIVCAARCNHLPQCNSFALNSTHCQLIHLDDVYYVESGPGQQLMTNQHVQWCQRKIVDEIGHNAELYPASSVFLDDCVPWYGPNGQIGSFTIDMGCAQNVTKIYYRNSVPWNWDTATFSVEGGVNGEWETILDSVNADITQDLGVNCNRPLDAFSLDEPVFTRYLRFIGLTSTNAGTAATFFGWDSNLVKAVIN